MMNKKSGLGSLIMPGMALVDAAEKTKQYKKMLDVQQAPLPPKTAGAKQMLRSYLHKKASLKTEVTKAMAVGAGLTAAGVGIGLASNVVGDMYVKLQAARMFAELSRRHSEVRGNKRAREYFDLIVAYAPSLLRHPNAIGDFLLRQLQYPMSSVEFIKQLADLEATVTKTDRGSLGMNIGAQASGMASNVAASSFVGKRR
jgi:hypothetical protein